MYTYVLEQCLAQVTTSQNCTTVRLLPNYENPLKSHQFFLVYLSLSCLHSRHPLPPTSSTPPQPPLHTDQPFSPPRSLLRSAIFRKAMTLLELV